MDDAQPLRTIVVDDDPLVRRLIRDVLQMDGVTVIAEAGNGQEAMELALFYRPDVVLMDFMMPELDGIEATRRICERDPGIRVVLLSGAADDELGLRGLRAGAAGFLSKDMELASLPRVLRRAAAGEAAISRALVLSHETVRTHLKNLYRKLQVRSRPDAIQAAVRLRDLSGVAA